MKTDYIENPIVGKYYDVKCAKMVRRDDPNDFYFIPVIGEPHKDKFFNHKHIHIDGRFVSKKHFQNLRIDENGRTNTICNFEDVPDLYLVDTIVVKRMKCKRQTTGILVPERAMKNGGDFFDWSQTMIGKSCKGKKCPHLGFPMKEEDSVLVCPLHNLMSDKAQEKIIGVKIYKPQL